VSFLRNNLAWVSGIVLILGLSFLMRHVEGRQLELEGFEGWVTTEADSLYHMRRVDRALTEGFSVAGTDEALNYPEGSAIPWPPYYTYLVAAAIGPFVPEDEAARRAFVEESVASFALLFGVLTTLVACLAGGLLAGRLGALAAGSYHALCHISIAYSNLGNGDHHSFVSFVSGALLLSFAWLLKDGRIHQRRTALLTGVVCGALLGLLLGAWLGSMVLLIAVELALAWLIFRQARRHSPGLALFGLSFHATALVVIAPAVLASPWTEIEPWMLVNLSYLHPAFLILGGLVFVPLLKLKEGSKVLVRYPWIVGALLAVLGAIIALTDLALSSSVREGFDWASKTNEFMAGIAESRSLFAGGDSPGPSFELGFGFWALPLILLTTGVLAWRRGKLELLPWLFAALLAALQASQQARFAESLALPLSVLVGWAIGTGLSKEARPTFLKSLPGGVLFVAAVGLAIGANGQTASKAIERLKDGRPSPQQQEKPSRLASRYAARWIRNNTPRSGDYSVLANWSLGHTIEWAADRPSVATNFGSYVGEAGFRAPAQFFMAEDPAEAEKLLVRHRVRYVLLGSDLPDQLNSMIARANPELRSRWIQSGTEGQVALPWFQTMGARLMFDGTIFQGEPKPQLNFLRLVYLSPMLDPGRPLRDSLDLSPAALVWERVQGARVECSGEPGEALTIDIQLGFPRSARQVRWKRSAGVEDGGRASLRVPYATEQPNGQARSLRATWSIGTESGTLVIDEASIQSGATIQIQRVR
jgi:asparagine N-glycosylation enzyme membrane subunit Stt3